MTDHFSSPKRRVARANEHVRHLEREITAYLEGNPYARVVEPSADGTLEEHKIKFVQLLPDAVSDIAADALDSLRSALDQAAYGSAIALGKVNPKSTYFPFADSAGELENVIKGRCRDLHPDIVTLARGFKPYKGGNDLLFAMNKARQSNQHKILTAIGVVVGGVNIRQMHIAHAEHFALPMPTWNREKNEIVFAIMGQGTEIHYDLQIAFDVAFDKVEIIDGQPAIAVLKYLSKEIERIVFAIEAETARILSTRAVP